MSDIDTLAAAAYANGDDPTEWAIRLITNLLVARDTARHREQAGLPALPAWQQHSDDTVARKILGWLLDAGWHAPSAQDMAAAAERSNAGRRRFESWWATLTPQQRDVVIEHYSETGEFPPRHQPPAES